MYGKLFSIFGIAFMLFMAVMVFTALLRTGFSGILKAIAGRLLIMVFLVSVALSIGITIYSLVVGDNPIDTMALLIHLVKSQI